MAKKVDCRIPPRIFIVNKPRGITSGDVLSHFKYNLPRGYGKIGHFGTLDPFAEGILLIAVGQAARLNFLFSDLLTKTYHANGVFNISSTTGDSEGELSSPENKEIPDIKLLVKTFDSMKGKYLQVPPHYSAVKFEGKALYKYAREGILIDKPPVERFIYQVNDINLLENYKKIEFTVEVSSGTYIRTLFEDFCHRLGLVGHLDYLKRISIGKISHEKALNQGDWPSRGDDFDIIQKSFCPRQFFPFYDWCVDEQTLYRIENGQRILVDQSGIQHDLSQDNFCWVSNDKKELRALCQILDGVISPKIIFPNISTTI